MEKFIRYFFKEIRSISYLLLKIYKSLFLEMRNLIHLAESLSNNIFKEFIAFIIKNARFK